MGEVVLQVKESVCINSAVNRCVVMNSAFFFFFRIFLLLSVLTTSEAVEGDAGKIVVETALLSPCPLLNV